jgi:adenosylcobinamide-phosphate synthase
MFEVLFLAVIIDVLFGELPSRFHPVVFMGYLITRGRAWCERRGNQLFWGLFLLIYTVGVVLLILEGVLMLVHQVPYIVQVIFYACLLKMTFSIRFLHSAAMAVQSTMEEPDVEEARRRVGELVSRDTGSLSEEKIISATCESVAESLTDSIIAPLCWYLVLGLPGAFFYRTINTLDSMIGYRHLEIGTASARLDDILNFIPARIAGGLILVAGALLSHDVIYGLSILKRDRNTPQSPNAGYTMAPVAGLLRVRFEKEGYYTLGDPLRSLSPSHIQQTLSIVEGSALIFLVCSSPLEVIM